MSYNFKKIEKKWQKKWEQEKVFEVDVKKKSKKFYLMEMFPYPSALGLHLGHALNYTIGDILARFKRMNGFNVLYPMGFDSLGLPAENAAIKAGEHPKPYTARAIRNYIKQMKDLGLSYDWSKLVNSMEPEYYKWNQLFFLKFLEKGLAYRKKSAVNWCPKCNTVLANEQVVGGCCWRHEDTEVEIKHLKQWFLKITDYADELLDCIDDLQWPQKIKTMQKNWIGKSYGTEIDFEIETPNKISNVVIVHGSPKKERHDEFPQNKKHWILWLKKELENQGIKTHNILMPQPWKPNYEDWKKEFEKLDVNENTILIGHSAGGAFMVRWLSEKPRKIKKLVLIAPSKETTKDSLRLKEFCNFEVNKKIKEFVDDIVIFISNDKKETIRSADFYQKKFSSKLINLKHRGHFTLNGMGTNEFPELLNEIISNKKFPVFTTRPDTIYGVTFMVISAQHEKLMELVTKEQKKEVEKFLHRSVYPKISGAKKIKSISEKEKEFLEKEGVFTGSSAINPITNEKVPVYAGNFVVADYGSGMVMGVPAHDQRDFDFAKKYGLEIKPVVMKNHGESYSFVMGVNEKEIKNIGIQIIEKTKNGFFKIKIPFSRLEEYKDFIRKKLQPGFWNEFSTEKGFYFIFKHKNGKLEELELDEKTNDLIDKYGATFNDEEPSKESKNVYSWVAENDFYKELLIHQDKGILINSEKFNGLDNEKAKEEITKFLGKKKLGRKKVQFKMRDWLISRQRYWGTPIPIVYCEKCGIVPVDEKDLPIKLPEKVKFGKGNPLATNEKFVNVKCPKCGGKARRETDTMDTFVDSSWYFMRYPDNKNSKKPFDKKIEEDWLPVDQYIGGIEHATMHLLYARFWTKALRDLGYINYGEPFTKLFNQGILHGEDGERMSKSKGNVILPEVVSKKYGTDTARFFLMFLAAPDKPRDWSDKGVQGSLKFINKVMNYFENVKISTQGRTPSHCVPGTRTCKQAPNNIQKNIVTKGKKSSARIESKLNKAIKEVTNQIENFKYNLAVIKIRDLFNSLPSETSKDVLEKSLKLLHPFCPHITEELWEKLGNKNFISLEKWPVVDEKKIDDKFEKQDEFIRKVAEDIIHIKGIVGIENPKVYIYAVPPDFPIIEQNKELISNLSGSVVLPYSTNDKNLVDPNGKSKKAKFGKPGIHIEPAGTSF